MKQELKDKLLDSLNSKGVKDIIDSKDFYFQKAIDKYNELLELPKLGEEVTSKLVNEVNELRNSNSFNYVKFLKSNKNCFQFLKGVRNLVSLSLPFR